MKFVQARHFTPASRTAIDLVVIHTAEAHERPNTAENVAAFFAGAHSSRASAHYTVDVDSIVQSVHEKDVAWHAGPVNGYSIGVEHAGFAKQSVAEWQDEYSQAMLERSALLVADICRRHGIPVRRVTAEDLKAGGERRRGICGHIDVTTGLTGGKGHWDPGPNFPWSDYLARVEALVQEAPMSSSNGPAPTLDIDLAPREGAWVEVTCKGQRWLVAPTYMAPVGIAEALMLARANDAELPSPELVDAIWAAADLKLAPLPRKHDGTPKTMASRATYEDQADRIKAQVAGRSFRLLAGTHKDVVLKDGKPGLYGWHRPDGSVIQPFYSGHAPAWKDYSQGCRLVRKA